MDLISADGRLDFNFIIEEILKKPENMVHWGAPHRGNDTTYRNLFPFASNGNNDANANQPIYKK